MITLRVNGTSVEVDAAPETPLLWVLREELNATGTKFGCGVSLCGACTVLMNGRPIRSCVTPVSQVGDAYITTIEGVSTPDITASPTASPTASTTAPTTASTTAPTTAPTTASPTGSTHAPRHLVAAAVQDAWAARSVAQCGYCQSGMILAAVALLADNAMPSDADIDEAFSGHICRCGSYQRLRAAVHDAAGALRNT